MKAYQSKEKREKAIQVSGKLKRGLQSLSARPFNRSTFRGKEMSFSKMACSDAYVKERVRGYRDNWPKENPTQSEMFRKWVPDEAVDFTESYRSMGFDKIFTCERVRTSAGFNCHHLYRQMKTTPDILVYSDDKTSVFQPLGEPGRDVDKNKDSHVMAANHSTDGSLTFNECLPTTAEEDEDLVRRVALLHSAVSALRRNAPVSECGPKVVEKAQKMGVSDMNIRQFFLHQILSLSPETLEGPPGYVLNVGGVDIGKDKGRLEEVIGKVFDDTTLKPMMFVQPPDRSTQFVSHIHCFMLNPSEILPKELDENYVEVGVIQSVKRQLSDEGCELTRTATPPIETLEPAEQPVGMGNVDEGCELTRTATPPIETMEPEPEPEVDMGVGLSRQSSVFSEVKVS